MTKKGFKVGYVLHIPDFFESIDCTKLATRITKKTSTLICCVSATPQFLHLLAMIKSILSVIYSIPDNSLAGTGNNFKKFLPRVTR